jgi:hypothetical protein
MTLFLILELWYSYYISYSFMSPTATIEHLQNMTNVVINL